MRHIILLLTVALVMAAMLALNAGAAFGQPPFCTGEKMPPSMHASRACADHPPIDVIHR